MVKISKEAALEYHEAGRPGKIEVKPTKAYRTQTDLSLAYSPGVAYPCLEIQQDSDNAYKYTDKGNLVAVISNGTAVLGLGDIGAMSGKPVMEGKGLLFKIYGGIDVFDIEVDEKDPEKFCEAVEKIAPTFGGINLEDIKAPECFYIEERLKKSLDIPVMHDDQHGTAIISAAGLKNALEVIHKDITKVKVVVNGAGAAAISCTKLYMALGVQKENIVMLDSKGVISVSRQDLNEQKRFFATSRTDIHTLEEAVNGADVFPVTIKGISDHLFAGFEHQRQEILTEVAVAVGILRILDHILLDGLPCEYIDAHRGVGALGMLGLFLKFVNRVVGVGIENTETRRFLHRNVHRGDGAGGVLFLMIFDHIGVIHLVDMVAG